MEPRRKITVPDAPPVLGGENRDRSPTKVTEADTAQPEGKSAANVTRSGSIQKGADSKLELPDSPATIKAGRKQVEAHPEKERLATPKKSVSSPPIQGGHAQGLINAGGITEKRSEHKTATTESPNDFAAGEKKESKAVNESAIWLAVTAAMTLILMAFIFELSYRKKQQDLRPPASSSARSNVGNEASNSGRSGFGPIKDVMSRASESGDQGILGSENQKGEMLAVQQAGKSVLAPTQPAGELQPVLPSSHFQRQGAPNSATGERAPRNTQLAENELFTGALRPSSNSSGFENGHRAMPATAATNREQEFIPVPIVARLKVTNVAHNDTLAIRSGPSAVTSKVGAIPHNAKGIGLLTRSATQNGRDFWFPIFWRGTRGWVNGNYVDYE